MRAVISCKERPSWPYNYYVMLHELSVAFPSFHVRFSADGPSPPMPSITVIPQHRPCQVAPLQVGVGTPGGTETVAHALALALAEDPETVVISVDMANAFNSIHRAAMLAAVQQSAPALLPSSAAP